VLIDLRTSDVEDPRPGRRDLPAVRAGRRPARGHPAVSGGGCATLVQGIRRAADDGSGRAGVTRDAPVGGDGAAAGDWTDASPAAAGDHGGGGSSGSRRRQAARTPTPWSG